MSTARLVKLLLTYVYDCRGQCDIHQVVDVIFVSHHPERRSFGLCSV